MDCYCLYLLLAGCWTFFGMGQVDNLVVGYADVCSAVFRGDDIDGASSLEISDSGVPLPAGGRGCRPLGPFCEAPIQRWIMTRRHTADVR